MQRDDSQAPSPKTAISTGVLAVVTAAVCACLYVGPRLAYISRWSTPEVILVVFVTTAVLAYTCGALLLFRRNPRGTRVLVITSVIVLSLLGITLIIAIPTLGIWTFVVLVYTLPALGLIPLVLLLATRSSTKLWLMPPSEGGFRR